MNNANTGPGPRGAHRPSEHISEENLRAEAVREPEHGTDRVRKRTRNANTNADEFYVNREEIPEGLDYNWKRFSVNGLEDPFYLARMREQGWEPVPPARHPNWVPPGYNAPYILKGGQILMDRPMELTLEARAEDRAAAIQQIVVAEQKLGRTPKGEMTRDYEGARPKIIKEVGRMVPMGEE
jgi:hypothetical protein